MTSNLTETVIEEIMSGGIDQNPISNIEVDGHQSIVPGLTDGIQLLPHQILGRAWMRDRENFAQKRAGGILADDMGLGKTIQMLTRIIEGIPTSSELPQEWSPSTLVVCPLSLVTQWVADIQNLTKLTVLRYQGSNRARDIGAFYTHNIVVTTYDTVKSEHASFTSGGSARCGLFAIRWWRIILDEAHVIKNPTTKGALACCELKGRYRWCLTGTPVQNDVVEIHSLIKFLKIKPLSDWGIFNEQISKPLKSGRGASRAIKCLQVVLSRIMLRRLKTHTTEDGEPLVTLPKRVVEIVSCPFDAFERKFYFFLEAKLEHSVNSMDKKMTGSQYLSALSLLLRLRQACDHPTLAIKFNDETQGSVRDLEAGEHEGDVDAVINTDLTTAFSRILMTDSFKCQTCTADMPLNDGRDRCQECTSLTITAQRLEDKKQLSSAKIRMILKILDTIDSRSRSTEKTIIFSQFSRMLDLIGHVLTERGVQWVQYDGKMTTHERDAALKQITTSSTTRIILMSFKTGCAGLNLTVCNNVILVDMWWNPALEDQAFDRAHRLGQKRDVYIYKLKVDRTVEDRILLLQNSKRALATAALTGGKIESGQLRMGELVALFKPGVGDNCESAD